MPRKYQFPFELRHLIYFREVAEKLHFRRAAESLAVAQPALSRQIAQFEEALGVALFRRSSRKVELTAAGQRLAIEVEPLLQALAAVPAALRAVADGQVGHIRISFTGLAMATVLPALLREFHKQHAGIRLELNESPTSAQLLALQSGEISCGFFHPEGATPGLETRLLLQERNGVLLPADHPLAAHNPLKLKDLENTPFVLFSRSFNPGYYDRTLAAFAEAGVTPLIAEEVWPRANGIGLVRAGLGAMLLCESEAKQLPAEVVFRRLVGPAPDSRLVVGWKRGTDDAAVLKFLALVAK
jgi:DNA-binding transcriptional LysR family regulator